MARRRHVPSNAEPSDADAKVAVMLEIEVRERSAAPTADVWAIMTDAPTWTVWSRADRADVERGQDLAEVARNAVATPAAQRRRRRGPRGRGGPATVIGVAVNAFVID